MQRMVKQVRRIPNIPLRSLATRPPPTTPPGDPPKDHREPAAVGAEHIATTEKSTQTVAEKDFELMQKLAGISGDGGESGVEYEDGKASAMKRSVKNNMFRLI